MNLHGNSNKKECAPDGSNDENVFDIQQGVSIGIFIKKEITNLEKIIDTPTIYYADLWGKRDGKYVVLAETDVNTTNWLELKPSSPHYLFVPQNTNLLPEYEKGWMITDIFLISSTGIVTSHDDFIIDFNEAPIHDRIKLFLDNSVSDIEIKEKLKLTENYAWRVSEARKLLMADKYWEIYFNNIIYRPFDSCFIYYHPSVVWSIRDNVMRNMFAGQNLA